MKIALYPNPKTGKQTLSVSHSYQHQIADTGDGATEQRTTHVEVPIDPKMASDVQYVLGKVEAIIEKIIRHVYYKNQV